MRYLPHTPQDIEAMMTAIGVGNFDELFAQVPEDLRERAKAMSLPAPLGEIGLERHLKGLAARNEVANPGVVSFLGAGAYEHHVPTAISQLLLRAEFLTSYTPYQPEISQGTTKAIFEFQSMVSEVLDMPIANASMYDGAHATAEASLMAQRLTRRTRVLVASSVHPEYRHVIRTYLSPQPGAYVEFEVDPHTGRVCLERLVESAANPQDVACVIFQTPNFLGVLENPAEVVAWAQKHKILTVAAFNEPHAFALSAAPGTLGVDICAGEAMGFGVGLNFGGPALGVFACREKYLRSMPGRLAGHTVDTKGREGFVLTLSTREQHIRREKATSNICTNQGLMALAACIYLSLMGKQGLRELASLNVSRASFAKEALLATGKARLAYSAPVFNEFVLELQGPAAQLVERGMAQGLLPGYDLGRVRPEWQNHLLVAVTDMTDRAAIERLVELLDRG